MPVRSLPIRAAIGWLACLGTRQLLAIGFGVVLTMLALITVLAQWQLTRSIDHVQLLAAAQKSLSDLTRGMEDDVGSAYQALLSIVLVSEVDDVAFQRQRITDALQRGDVPFAVERWRVTAPGWDATRRAE